MGDLPRHQDLVLGQRLVPAVLVVTPGAGAAHAVGRTSLQVIERLIAEIGTADPVGGATDVEGTVLEGRIEMAREGVIRLVVVVVGVDHHGGGIRSPFAPPRPHTFMIVGFSRGNKERRGGNGHAGATFHTRRNLCGGPRPIAAVLYRGVGVLSTRAGREGGHVHRSVGGARRSRAGIPLSHPGRDVGRALAFRLAGPVRSLREAPHEPVRTHPFRTGHHRARRGGARHHGLRRTGLPETRVSYQVDESSPRIDSVYCTDPDGVRLELMEFFS